MSHFAVMVIGAEPEEQLAPFDENLEMLRYVEYTKLQLIEKGKKRIEDYRNGVYAGFLADPEKYKADCKNQKHIDYLENEFPKKLNWTDEEIYANQLDGYESFYIGKDGEVYSTCNPNSKWDWHEIGGRWAGLLKLKSGVTPIAPINFSWGWEDSPEEMKKILSENRADMALKNDIENLNEIVCFALLKGGQWFERGEMGWWGCVSNERPDDEWDEEFKKLVSELPDETLITIVDCHI